MFGDVAEQTFVNKLLCQVAQAVNFININLEIFRLRLIAEIIPALTHRKDHNPFFVVVPGVDGIKILPDIGLKQPDGLGHCRC